MIFRSLIYEKQVSDWSMFFGEIELDEAYFTHVFDCFK